MVAVPVLTLNLEELGPSRTHILQVCVWGALQFQGRSWDLVEQLGVFRDLRRAGVGWPVVDQLGLLFSFKVDFDALAVKQLHTPL